MNNAPSGGQENYICCYKVLKDYSEKWPVEMVLCEKAGRRRARGTGSGRTSKNVVIDHGQLIVDGAYMDGEDAVAFVAMHRLDMERLLVESAKLHGEEKSVIRDLTIAKLADKAGLKGKYALVRFTEGKKLRSMQIRGSKDGPVFTLDGQEITRARAVRLFDENYTSIMCNIQKTEAGIGGYHVEEKVEEKRAVQSGKPLFDLDEVLPARKRTVKPVADKHSIGGMLFPTSQAKSHLKEGGRR